MTVAERYPPDGPGDVDPGDVSQGGMGVSENRAGGVGLARGLTISANVERPALRSPVP